MLSEKQILAHIERLPHGRAGFKQLLRELHIKGGERRELRAMLNHLVRSRRLLEYHHHYELPPKPVAVSDARRPRAGAATGSPVHLAANELTGRISVHRDGYAFVLPDIPRADLEGDIFIPPPFVGDAMHGDTVVVRLVKSNAQGRVEGRVLRVARRAHATIVGEFHYGPRANFVRPFDDRLREVIIIPRGQEIPPAVSETQRHRVLGEEARRRSESRRLAAAAPADRGAPPLDLEGVVVDVEITSFRSATAEARGRVIEVLGHRDEFGVDVEIIIRKHHLPHRFPMEVLEEAQRIPAPLPAAELAARRDFRALPIVTIDGETARDFDDAVYVERHESGGYELQVHIADVAWYVEAGGPIDREARLRGTSVYFPDRAVPMLPAELSTDLCSLRPHVDRLVMSCIIRISPAGEVVNYEIVPGVIRSAERMTYTAVNAVLSGDRATRTQYAALVPHFERMLELEQILQRKRVRRGAIDFDLPEPEIAFDEFGLMHSIVQSERNVAHRIIEEFMLIANETVARHLEAADISSVYRIHEKPDAKKVAEFEEIALSFGYSLGVGALPIRRVRQRVGGRIRTIELPVEQDFHITPRQYQKLAQRLENKPEERILSYLMLRSLKQARYSAENVGHFALAAPTYTHFTSPIRRYPDLLVHRLLKFVLGLAGGARHESRGGRMLAAPGERSAAATALDRPLRRRVNIKVGRVGRVQPEDSNTTAYPRVVRSQGDEPHVPANPGAMSFEEIQGLCREASDAERRADEAERELMDWKKVRFMESRVGEEFAALILHVTKAGFFVELIDLFIDGFVPLASLDDDRYFFRESEHALVGDRSKRRYGVGDRIKVVVDRIDPVRHSINFAPTEILEPAPRRTRRHSET